MRVKVVTKVVKRWMFKYHFSNKKGNDKPEFRELPPELIS